MIGLKIENNDCVRDASGNAILIEGQEFYIQRIRHRINFLLGESEYDLTAGIDWLTIFQDRINKDRILNELSRAILADSETTSIESIEVGEYDSADKKIKIIAKINSKYGTATVNS